MPAVDGAKDLPYGVFPTMITPFLPSGAVDYETLPKLVDWYIKSGVQALFAVCLSSEMYNLSPEERIELARAVNTAAKGRVPVIASGTFGGSLESQAEFINKMAVEVDAVVVICCQLATEDEDDSVWKANAEKLLALTGDVRLGLYECPKPYHRLLSADLLAWAASTGRFLFHKDTHCQTQPIAAKIAAVQSIGETPFKFYNANVATLLFSLEKGGHGFSGISANFYPFLLVWLAANHKTNPKDATRVQQFLSVAENVVMYKYPLSAKQYLRQQGLPINLHCRNMDATLNEEEEIKLKDLHSMVQSLCESIGIQAVSPV